MGTSLSSRAWEKGLCKVFTSNDGHLYPPSLPHLPALIKQKRFLLTRGGMTARLHALFPPSVGSSRFCLAQRPYILLGALFPRSLPWNNTRLIALITLEPGHTAPPRARPGGAAPGRTEPGGVDPSSAGRSGGRVGGPTRAHQPRPPGGPRARPELAHLGRPGGACGIESEPF